MFDGTVFLLTIARTWSLSRQARAAGIEASQSALLLRDGSFLPITNVQRDEHFLRFSIFRVSDIFTAMDFMNT